MFCEKCGADINEDTVFCSKCGQKVKGSEAESAAEALPLTKPTKNRTWIVLFSVIFLAVIAAGGVYWYVSTQNAASAAEMEAAKAEADKAIEAVGKINAAVGVGVTYQNYGMLLNEAAAGVEAFQPKDATSSRIRDLLGEAVLYYQAGGEAWYTDIQDDVVDVSSWKVQYPKVDFGSDEGDKALGDTARQAAWAVAGEAYDQAKLAAASYEQ